MRVRRSRPCLLAAFVASLWAGSFGPGCSRDEEIKIDANVSPYDPKPLAKPELHPRAAPSFRSRASLPPVKQRPQTRLPGSHSPAKARSTPASAPVKSKKR